MTELRDQGLLIGEEKPYFMGADKRRLKWVFARL
jgi:hypothetical protein